VSAVAEANQKLSPIQIVRKQLTSDEMLHQLRSALPKHIDENKFVRTTITVINQAPELLDCDRTSLFAAIMGSAQLGLMPESFMGECYFIPYNRMVTLQMGYKGLLKLARNTGEIKSIDSGVIHENDHWEYEEGDNGHFLCKPNFLEDRGKPIIVWCVIKLNSGEVQRELMSASDVEAIRVSSNSKNSPAWKNHWGQMARKVVIKRALKYAPSSTELLQAIAMDDGPESGKVVGVDEAGELQMLSAPAAETAEKASEPAPAPTKEKKASTASIDALAEEHLSKHVEGELVNDEVGFHDSEDAELAPPAA